MLKVLHLQLQRLEERGRRLAPRRSQGIGVGQQTTTTMQAGEEDIPKLPPNDEDCGPSRFFVTASNHRGHFSRFFASWHAYRIHRFKHVTFTSIHHPPTHPFHCHQLHPVSNPSHLSRGQRHWQFRDPSSSHVVFFSYSMFNVSILYILILLNSSSHDAPRFSFFHTQHSTAAFP